VLFFVTLALRLPPSGVSSTPATAQERRLFEPNTRQEAIDAIPFDQLTEDAQAKLTGVISRSAIYRRLPVTVVPTDPDLYVFLIRYPEVVVNIWDLMGVTRVQVQRTGDFAFEAVDGAGTSSQVELIYGDRETHVYYAEGVYEGPLLGRLIEGRCVLVLKTEYKQTDDEQVYATSRLDMFLQFDNIGAELLARTLHPLVGKSADHNFVESTKFLGQVSRAAEEEAIAMQHLANRLTKVNPEVREQFAVVSALVNQRAAIRGGTPRTSRHDVSRRTLEDATMPRMITDAEPSDAVRNTRSDVRLRR
jgi:hypothetical protein